MRTVGPKERDYEAAGVVTDGPNDSKSKKQSDSNTLAFSCLPLSTSEDSPGRLSE